MVAMTRLSAASVAIRRSLRVFGLRQSARLYRARYLEGAAAATGATLAFRPRGFGEPLRCRRGTSDPAVLKQIFVDRVYEPLKASTARTILDCGAYAGYSAAWLLSELPESRLVAVEPEERNFELLKQNLEPFGERATCLRAAVWSRGGAMRIRRPEGADWVEWAWQVEEAGAEDEPEIPAVTVPELMDVAGTDGRFVVKLDIEGAEEAVFGRGDTSWLARVDALAIELHGSQVPDDPAQPLWSAAAPYGFEWSRSGDLWIGVPARHGAVGR